MVAAAKEETLKAEEYTYCRRCFLMMQILYRNSQRPGAVTNMTCEEATKVECCVVKDRSYLIVQVADHKTSLTYGVAKLVMDEEVAAWFINLCDIVRPQIGWMNAAAPF